MYKIWLCEYYGNLSKENVDISLSYNKLLYEDIKKEQLDDYLDYICGDLKCTRGAIIEDRYVKIFDLGNKDYCFFLEEQFSGDDE